MISGHPVDLLPDRKSSTLAAWLDGRPEVEVICRGSGRAYAEAATQAAPPRSSSPVRGRAADQGLTTVVGCVGAR
jgi:hypothetical protein